MAQIDRLIERCTPEELGWLVVALAREIWYNEDTGETWNYETLSINW